MPWIQASNGANYTARMAVTLDTTAATPGGPAVSGRITIKRESSQFWATVQANGYDIRIADAAGTVIAHERATWDYAGQVAEIDLEYTLPAAAPSGAASVLYLYFAPESVVSADPSAGPFGSSVAGYAMPPMSPIPNQHVAVNGAAWTLPTSTNTPAPSQTVGVIVDEKRHLIFDLGRGLSYAPGWLRYGSSAAADVSWLASEVTGSALSAPNWIDAADFRVWVDENGATARNFVECDDPSDALAIVTAGWSDGEVVKYAFKIVGLDPTI